jgi:hypothetical protein
MIGSILLWEKKVIVVATPAEHGALEVHVVLVEKRDGAVSSL